MTFCWEISKETSTKMKTEELFILTFQGSVRRTRHFKRIRHWMAGYESRILE